MLGGKLYLVEFYADRGVIEAGYFDARSDKKLVEEFEDSIKSLQMLGPVEVLGFYDDEEDAPEPVKE
jgi:hypothetical protein